MNRNDIPKEMIEELKQKAVLSRETMYNWYKDLSDHEKMVIALYANTPAEEYLQIVGLERAACMMSQLFAEFEVQLFEEEWNDE